MKRHPFSMVEILLALGVVAIGICSVMVLFPVGASATRDAAMETYAANAADQILHMVKYKLTMADANNQWYTYICNQAGVKLDNGIYSSSESGPSSSAFENPSVFDDTDKWSNNNDLIGGTTLQDSGIFPYTDSNHYYQIIVHRGNTNDDFNTVVNSNVTDFRALATLWASEVNVPVTGNLPLNFATRLNLKIEWPVELPQSARQSAYYTLEIFNNR